MKWQVVRIWGCRAARAQGMELRDVEYGRAWAQRTYEVIFVAA